jgi:hypothetical protein
MAYYDALVAIWPTVQGADTATKLAALNAQTVAGPNRDVQTHEVIGQLVLSNAFLPLAKFAQGTFTGDTTHDNALGAAMMLMAVVQSPNAPLFKTSDPTAFAQIKALTDAILAQETAAPGSTGFTQSIHDSLLSLASTTVPWTQANGYPVINNGDLAMASLEGMTPWTHGPYVLNGPDAAGNMNAVVDFWDTADPATVFKFTYNTNSPDKTAIDSWAALVMRTQANRAVLTKQFA